jgi:hypothetical protein
VFIPDEPIELKLIVLPDEHWTSSCLRGAMNPGRITLICALWMIAAPIATWAASIEQKVLDIERTIDRDFRLPQYVGGVPNRILVPRGKALDETHLFDGMDSALFTGIYLGSQCIKDALLTDPVEQALTQQRIRSLLDTLETYSKITGIPGLIARYVYDPSLRPALATSVDPLKDSIGRPWNCDLDPVTGSPEQDSWQWMASGSRYWCGRTSRDQYSGYFFGLQTCMAELKDQELKKRVARLVRSIVPAVVQNNMRVPYGKYDPLWGDFSAKILGGNVGRLLLVADRDASEILGEPFAFSSQLQTSYGDMVIELLGTQSWFNQFFEYYSYNLTSLTKFATLESKHSPENKQLLSELWKQHLWQRTLRDRNAQFTGMHLSLFPEEKSQFTQIAQESRKVIAEVIDLPRNSISRGNPSQNTCQRLQSFTDVRDFLEELLIVAPFSELAEALRRGGKLPQFICSEALPLDSRVPSHYIWERSPYILAQSSNPRPAPTQQLTLHDSIRGDGDDYHPAVDTVFAYWLNRKAGVIRGGE